MALKLNQPQPSISASLRKLRELTGDPLLVRGARGMVPTQHGESLLKPAKRILDEAESMFVRKAPFVVDQIDAMDALDALRSAATVVLVDPACAVGARGDLTVEADPAALAGALADRLAVQHDQRRE